jgi:hypothetical protein
MAVADSHGLPISLCIESASPHEVTLVESTLVEIVIPEAPQNLVGDNAYDSDKLDGELRHYGIELTNRAAPQQSQEQNSRWASFAPIPPTLENRKAVCLASKLPQARHSVRAPCREFPGDAVSRCLPDHVEAFMRWVLDFGMETGPL